MSVAERRRQDAESSLSNLTLNPTSKSTRVRRPAAATPDSWDDSDQDSDATTPTSATPARPTHDLPHAPPPTPITPSMHAASAAGSGASSGGAADNPYGVYSPAHATEPLTPLRGHFRPPGGASAFSPTGAAGPSAAGADVRPDKSSATAARLIAGALGVRRPAESDESRAYERAVRERERGRVERQREERRQEEKRLEEARRSVWED